MRRLLVLSTVSALVLLACGGSKTAPITAISNAPAKTAGAGSAKLEVTVVSSTSKSGATTTTTAATPAGPTKVTGAVDFKASKGRFQIASPAFGSQPTDAVLVGQVFYFKGLAGMSLPGKPWIKFDLAKAGSSSVAAQLQSLNPNSYMAQLSGVSGDVRNVGKENVRGDDTTHYTFTVDLDKAARLAPAAQRAAIGAAAKTLVNKSVPTELWLDAKGRVRRFRQTVVIASGATTNTSDLTLEYYDFGTKVDATPPAADQTTDLTQILSSLGTG